MFEHKDGDGGDADSWTVVYDRACAATMVNVQHAVASSLDAFALNGLSYYHFLVEAKHPMAKVIAATWNGPLSWLFDAPVGAKAGLLKDWRKSGPRVYDNAAVLHAISNAATYGPKYMQTRDALRRAAVAPGDSKVIFKKIEEMHVTLADQLGLGADEFGLFGGKEQFAKWWLAKSIFCYWMTIKYIEAIVNGDSATVQSICESYVQHCKAALQSGDYTGAQLITSAIVGGSSAIKTPEMYCTIQMFLFSNMCASPGGYGKQLEDPANAATPAPNQAVATSVAQTVWTYYTNKD
jgi:hypothetical protein